MSARGRSEGQDVERKRGAWPAAGLLAAFVALTLAVLAVPDNPVDAAVMRFDAAHPWQPAIGAADVVIGLGSPLLVGAATLVVVLCRDRGRLLDPLARLLLVSVVVVVLKNVIGRAGPSLAVAGRDPILQFFESVHPADGAFPSGHTAASVVCVWLLLRPAGPLRPVGPLRPAGPLRRGAYLIWVALISASLIYENYHWVSDVVGSWLLGAFLLTVPIRGHRARRDPRPERAESSPWPVQRSWTPPSRGG